MTAATARAGLADRIRSLTDLLVGRSVPDDALREAIAALEAAEERLRAVAAPGKAPRGNPDHRGQPGVFFPTSPVIGHANPLAPPVDVWAVTGSDGRRELRGRVRFGVAYEGPPTCVHGGVIAQMFDEILGVATILTGTGGMTGTLTVRYRRPTPLLADLDVEARQVGVEGRKIHCRAGLYLAGELTAEADAIFITVPPEKVLAFVEEHVRTTGKDLVDPELEDLVANGGHFLGGQGVLGGVDGPLPR